MGRLVMAGAGHAHMALIEAISELTAEGHSVTVVGPGARHYYSGMGPGMLGGTYLPEEISFPVRALVEKGGGAFIQSKVAAIDAARRVVVPDSGRERFPMMF
jgi:NADH dehydrogenase FAD-containing subunit